MFTVPSGCRTSAWAAPTPGSSSAQRDERVEPAWLGLAVEVEEHQVAAASERGGLVAGAPEAGVLVVADELDAVVGGRLVPGAVAATRCRSR